jgi:hypothetical protein
MKLYFEAVPANLLALIRQLMEAPDLQDFFLVGGTALALQIGHRQSVDCDLFTTDAFDAEALAESLDHDYSLTEVMVSKNSITGRIADIKTDFIAHRYPLVESITTVENIRMASLADIAAMKLNAIANRGSKKDFWDIHALLNHLSFDAMLSSFQEKYPHASSWGLEKSLAYFKDAEKEPDPVSLSSIRWPQVKADILTKIRLQ